jgi:hypothetical protein
VRIAKITAVAGLLFLMVGAGGGMGRSRLARVHTKIAFTVNPATAATDFSAVVTGTLSARRGCGSGRTVVVRGSKTVGTGIAGGAVQTVSAPDGSFTATLQMLGGSGSYKYSVSLPPRPNLKKRLVCKFALLDFSPPPVP